MPLFRASSGPTGTAAWEEGPHCICACQCVGILPGQRDVEVDEGGHRIGAGSFLKRVGRALWQGALFASLCECAGMIGFHLPPVSNRMHAKSLQSCPTRSNPMDRSPPGSPV